MYVYLDILHYFNQIKELGSCFSDSVIFQYFLLHGFRVVNSTFRNLLAICFCKYSKPPRNRKWVSWLVTKVVFMHGLPSAIIPFRDDNSPRLFTLTLTL